MSDDSPTVTVPVSMFEALLAVGTLYVESFRNDEMLTLVGRMRLQEIEDIIAKYGPRY